MIVKAAHRRPEGPVWRLKSDGSPLTSDCLNISNYLKSQTSNLFPQTSSPLTISAFSNLLF